MAGQTVGTFENPASPMTYKPGAVDRPYSTVEISVSCRNLRDRDVFSRSDPMCVLYWKDRTTGEDREDRTEMIKDNLNPDFVHKFVLDYYFDEKQPLKFELYDLDSKSSNLKDHDYLGEVETSLGAIVGAPNGMKEMQLVNKWNQGKIIVRAEEVDPCKELVTLRFRANNLDKKDRFGKSDPYLEISKATKTDSGTSYTVVHRTEVVMKNLDPLWEPFTLPVRLLCNGDYDRTIRVECYDWNRNGRPDYIGRFYTTMQILSQGPLSDNLYELINEDMRRKQGYRNSGTVTLLSVKIDPRHTFVDFIQAGMQMSFSVAIDFSSSNGDPSDPRSLHYAKGGRLNEYATVITALGDILEDYDSDKLFPAYGFGGRFADGQVKQDINLNLDLHNPDCHGIAGILEAYFESLQRVVLSGPSQFAPVINKVARCAEKKMDGSEYFVLLIITRGVISDMEQTREAIARASALPMSVIIVGVGYADFTDMQSLDGHNSGLSHNDYGAERSIVQFVALRDFMLGRRCEVSQAELAKEALAEIPAQVVEWTHLNDIHPGRNGHHPNTRLL